MARTGVKSGDFLGLVALGSLIGNMVQAGGNRKLQAMYEQVVRRYQMLHGEYMAYRSLNLQLQSQVDQLRKENNRLSEELAKRPTGVKS